MVTGVGEVESVGLGLVSVGDGLGLGEVGLGVGLGVSLGVGVGLVGVGVGLVGVGVGVGLDGVGVGLVGVGVGVGVGLGGKWSGSHFWTITLAKRVETTGCASVVTGSCINGAADADVASTADATRTPPVTKPTVTGRACAKRMIMPLPALLVASAERLFSMEWLHQAQNAPPCSYALHWTPCPVLGATPRYQVLPLPG